MDETTKNYTLKLRMDSMTMEMLERARAYANLDKSKFIRQSVQEKAQNILKEQEKTSFSEEDWHTFFDMIKNPSKPTKHMKKAALLYKEIINSDEI